MTLTSRSLLALLVLCGMAGCTSAAQSNQGVVLQRSRHAPDDLEIAGSIDGVQPGQTRFVSYASLLSLPQKTYIVSDDPNFGQTVTISGVPLAKLPAWLGAKTVSAMIIAICDDQYAAHYPASYVSAHQPLLVLKVNGKPPEHWPLGVDRMPMGPYMVSHPSFKSSFRVLSHEDESQVPWGVVRLEIRQEPTVYASIEPRGVFAGNTSVQQGYTIARQNCFRCHSRSGEGGRKSTLLWGNLAEESRANPTRFDAYVRDPKKLNARSQMASSPQYDDATLDALRQYFATFAEAKQ